MSQSHTQSQSHHLPSGYPYFRDADVLIVSMSGQTWKLHTSVLAMGSAELETKMNSFPAVRLRKEERADGNSITRKLLMVKHQAAHNVDPHVLHYVDFLAVDPRKPTPIGFSLQNRSGQTPKFDKIYDNIFRLFYNLSPDFTPMQATQDPARPMHEALNVLTAASYLKALPSVRSQISTFLLSFNQLLWSQVEHAPEVWASVACKLHSPPIFREAMLHLAGRYHLQRPLGVKFDVLGNIEWGAKISELVRQKGRELKDYKLRAERLLFEFVPSRMRHEAKVQVGGIVAPGRNVYANDIYWWMALHLTRQYFTSAVLENRHHRAADGGISFYRTIAAPHSYLLDDTLVSFHTMFAMTPKSRVVFVHALNELKKDLAPIVKGLLVNHSLAMKRADAPPYKYLMCTVILDEELPWSSEIPKKPVLQAPFEDGQVEQGETVDNNLLTGNMPHTDLLTSIEQAETLLLDGDSGQPPSISGVSDGSAATGALKFPSVAVNTVPNATNIPTKPAAPRPRVTKKRPRQTEQPLNALKRGLVQSVENFHDNGPSTKRANPVPTVALNNNLTSSAAASSPLSDESYS